MQVGEVAQEWWMLMITAVWQLGISFFMSATFPPPSSGCVPPAGFLVKHQSFIFLCQCWSIESQPVWGIFLLAGNPNGRNSCSFTQVPVPLLIPLERQTNSFPSSYSNVTFFFSSSFFSSRTEISMFSEATVSGIIIRLSALLWIASSFH